MVTEEQNVCHTYQVHWIPETLFFSCLSRDYVSLRTMPSLGSARLCFTKAQSSTGSSRLCFTQDYAKPRVFKIMFHSGLCQGLQDYGSLRTMPSLGLQDYVSLRTMPSIRSARLCFTKVLAKHRVLKIMFHSGVWQGLQNYISLRTMPSLGLHNYVSLRTMPSLGPQDCFTKAQPSIGSSRLFFTQDYAISRVLKIMFHSGLCQPQGLQDYVSLRVMPSLQSSRLCFTQDCAKPSVFKIMFHS